MKLNVLFINDVHGYLAPHPELFYDETGEIIETAGGYARIASVVKAIREGNPNTLLFDGGDTLYGTKPIVASNGMAMVPILNALNIDALVGHWDFGYGPDQLEKINKQLDFPMLGCNVFTIDGDHFLQPTAMFEKEGVKIGVVGLCSMIIDKVMPEKMSKGLQFTSGVEEVPHHIKELKANDAAIIIVLSHNGFPQDVELLKRVDGIDICLSAHTHNRIYKPIEVNGAKIVQCGCHGAFVSNFTIELEDKKIKICDYEMLKVDDSIPENEAMAQLVNKSLEPYEDMRTKNIGRTKMVLHRYNTLNSTMDELLLKATAHATDTSIVFSNGWRYGAPIPVGSITENDLYNIAPMNPPLSTVELTGKEIKQMLEENLERTFSSDAFKQMGGYVKRVLGLQINMRIENPTGHRIQEIYYNGKHLEMDKTYRVSFITIQGVPKKYGKNRIEHPPKAVEAMKMYLKVHPDFNSDPIGSFRLV